MQISDNRIYNTDHEYIQHICYIIISVTDVTIVCMFLCLSYMSSLPHCSLLVQLALSSPGNRINNTDHEYDNEAFGVFL